MEYSRVKWADTARLPLPRHDYDHGTIQNKGLTFVLVDLLDYYVEYVVMEECMKHSFERKHMKDLELNMYVSLKHCQKQQQHRHHHLLQQQQTMTIVIVQEQSGVQYGWNLHCFYHVCVNSKQRMAKMHNDPNAVYLKPGETKELVWKFENVVELEYACNVPGHYESGMKGRFESAS